MAEEFERWPGRERRDPPRSSATWVVRSALARWLRAEAAGDVVENPAAELIGDGGSAGLRQPAPGSLIPNYHVIADG